MRNAVCTHWRDGPKEYTVMGCGLQVFASGQNQVASVPGSGNSDL